MSDEKKITNWDFSSMSTLRKSMEKDLDKPRETIYDKLQEGIRSILKQQDQHFELTGHYRYENIELKAEEPLAFRLEMVCIDCKEITHSES